MSRRRLLAACAGLGALVVVAACGGPENGGGPATNPSGQPTPTPRRFLGIFPEPPPPSPTPTPAPTILRFAHWEIGIAGQTLAGICDRFSRSTPRVVVRVDVAPFSTHFDRLRQAFASGGPPDVFVSSGVYVDEFVGRKALLDLAERLAADRIDLTAYWTDALTRPTGGHQFNLPLWTTSDVVFLNQDHLTQSRVSPPPDDWTWDNLLATARQLTIGKPGEIQRYGLLLIDDVQGGWGSFVASNGGDWLNTPSRKTALRTQSTQEALQWFADAIVVHHVAPTDREQQLLSRAGQVDPFIDGKVSMLVDGTWEMPAALGQARFQWDVRRLPRAPRTGQSTSLASPQPASIAQASPIPDVAWQFLRYLIQRDAQTMLAAGKVRIPTLKDVAVDQKSGYATAPPANAVAAVTALDNARDLAFVPGWQACRSAVIRALAPAFDGRIPLDDAVRQATSAGDAALASAGSG